MIPVNLQETPTEHSVRTREGKSTDVQTVPGQVWGCEEGRDVSLLVDQSDGLSGEQGGSKVDRQRD